MARNTREQAYDEALSIMNKNTSGLSASANKLISILEGAEGALPLREKISSYLHSSYSVLAGYNENDFQKQKNIKAKLAYLVKLGFSDSTNTNPRRVKVIGDINKYITKLNNHVLKNEDFSESTVIRLAALNRVKINLTDIEKAQLAGIASNIASTVKGDINLFSDLNLNHEINAQKIYKLKSLINTLIRNGKITHDNPDVVAFQNTFEPKLNTLNELDEKYHTLNNARNNFYKIQRGYGDIEVLSRSKHDDLCTVLYDLTKLDVKKYFNDKFNNKFDSVDLESELNNLKDSTDTFRAALKKANIKESDFDRYYLAHFSQEILKKAKVDFDAKKRQVFKDNTRDFESDVAHWRDMQRERIIHFATQASPDINSLTNIFDKDRKLFVLKNQNPVDADDVAIRHGLELVIQGRYTSLSGEQQQDLVDTILNENCVTNELYYGDNNRFMDEKDDTTMQNIMQRTSSAGRGIQNVEKFTTPIISGFVKFTKGLVEGVSGVTGKILTGTTSKVESIMKSYNTWAGASATSFLGKVAKFPFKTSLVLTKPTEWLASGTDWATKGAVNSTKSLYNWANNSIKNASDSKVDGLFDIFTKAYSSGLNSVGGLTEWGGDKGFDLLKTSQKREILEEFYSTRNSQDVRDILESIDIQSKLQDNGPHIFDDAEEDIAISEVVEVENEKDKIVKKVYKEFSEKLQGFVNNIDTNISLLSNTDNKEEIRAKNIIKSDITQIMNFLKNPLNTGFSGNITGKITQLFNKINNVTIGSYRHDLAQRRVQLNDDITNPTTGIDYLIGVHAGHTRPNAETIKDLKDEKKQKKKEIEDIIRTESYLSNIVLSDQILEKLNQFVTTDHFNTINSAYTATPFDLTTLQTNIDTFKSAFDSLDIIVS